jgi:zinc/manganese transport system substrate-binding protein
LRRQITMLAFAMSLVATACGPAQADPEGLDIVVTTNIWGDVVSNIVGDDANVEVLIPLGGDPHDFQASSAQVARINAADLVIANGLGLEEGLLTVLSAATADGVRVFEVAPRLDPIDFDFDHHGHDHDDDHDDHDDHDDDHDDHDDHDDDHDHDLDPHVWMDPVRMAQGARLIAAELALVAPDIDWAARAETYAASLMEAHREIEEMLGSVPPANREMITNHEVFGYFAERYDWHILGTIIPGGTSVGAPSAGDLADLIELIIDEGVRVIFVETSSPDTLARVIADEVGEQVRIVELHTESLGEPGSAAGTLIGMLKENARLISEAMSADG